jgi:peptide/nickel transport system permease protein
MVGFLSKRLGLAIVTLFLLSVLVFSTAQLLPGDVGRNVLGGFATQKSVDDFNHVHGLDRPIVVQYWDWVSSVLTGDLGKSIQYDVPVWSLLGPALVNSLKLAALAFVILVPLSILGGVAAALRQGKLTDRAVTVGGLSLTAIPEFVTGIVLIVVFGVVLKWLPTTAQAPSGAGFFTQLEHLLLPAFALVMVLFGYIARMARAGTIEALDADYTRTAYLKGLGGQAVLGKHVLRNALLPTIAVIATQVGYLIGGLVVIEKLFNYPGIGQRVYTAAQYKDYTVLEAGILIVGIVYLVATLAADILYAVLNPRIRHGAAE